MTAHDQQSLELHQKHGGKLAVHSKVPLETREDLARAYTPGVAAVCRAIAADEGAAKDYTIIKNTVAVVTDGSAVLGLGNIGPKAALPVMEGKAALFKEFADVDAFPICLSTQDTEEIIATVKRIAPGFGGINLEDISAPRCFEVEERLKRELDIPVFHDDQHGTAVVVLAGLINALRLRGSHAADVRVVINGAGAAGVAVARLLGRHGFANLTACDSHGIIHAGREEGMNAIKTELAALTGQVSGGTLADALAGADVFIGVSKGGVLTPAMVRTMNERPIIFALANPEPEIMPEAAHAAGAFIVATGRSDFPNQVNNVLAFPGIFRGALDSGVRDITPEMLIRAAAALAGHVKEPTAGNILPDPLDRTVAAAVAREITAQKETEQVSVPAPV